MKRGNQYAMTPPSVTKMHYQFYHVCPCFNVTVLYSVCMHGYLVNGTNWLGNSITEVDIMYISDSKSYVLLVIATIIQGILPYIRWFLNY